MVSDWVVLQQFVTGTNTPCALPLVPQVALAVVKVMESAKTLAPQDGPDEVEVDVVVVVDVVEGGGEVPGQLKLTIQPFWPL